MEGQEYMLLYGVDDRIVCTVYTPSQSLTVFKLASTIPICVGMIVRAYTSRRGKETNTLSSFC